MNSARITQNALFALAFLLGCAAIWTGLRTLVHEIVQSRPFKNK